MKLYIKNMSVEEIISRLKKGERIHNRVHTHYYCMIDGVICCTGRYGKSINPEINVLDEDYYFEVPDPIKLEVGKTYKTRNCSKAVISEYKESLKIYVGVIIGEGHLKFWDDKGKFTTDKNHKFDIISEWSD